MAIKTINIADKETLDNIKNDTEFIKTHLPSASILDLREYNEIYDSLSVPASTGKETISLSISGEGYIDLLGLTTGNYGQIYEIIVDGITINKVKGGPTFFVKEDMIKTSGVGASSFYILIPYISSKSSDGSYMMSWKEVSNNLKCINNQTNMSTLIDSYPASVRTLNPVLYFKQSFVVKVTGGSGASSYSISYRGGLKK